MLKRLEAADPTIELAPFLEIAHSARKRFLGDPAERGGDDRATDVDDILDRRGAAFKPRARVEPNALKLQARDAPAIDERARIAGEARRVGSR